MSSLSLLPKKEELPKINNEVSKYLKTLRDTYNVELIIEEWFVNIINYSNASFVKVNINCIDDNLLVLEFIDDGVEFNIFDYDVSLDSNVGGLGIHFIKTYSDKVEYEYKDSCNIVRIFKTLNGV